ncbi:hypothetical protein PLESTB_000340000 [Pleodorina starrii]|uniref:Uncharacterized protein n=1 Tax=Pleodorina starrii TaxID=330485 RepID=A0A9W6BE30_9CHLO|nr:hypothetical protein PLESTM_000054100 [Pleodorina starrii]GLC50080.1 hypothetical protein PLESTB_000340000 [Pleodorina starrii]GLC73138.1 hypothetical protein PLESTF_001336200 [Pleodorina starrii]
MERKQNGGGGQPTGKAQQHQRQQQQHQAQTHPTRSEEASIRELVESCLVNEDFTPVLRLVFGSSSIPAGLVSAGSFQPNGDSAAAARRSPPSKPAQPHPPATGAVLDGRPALEVLQSVLRSIADEQDAIVHDVCSSHSMEIATCVAELDRMVVSVEDLRKAVAAGGEELQRAGVALASTARELHGLMSAQRHLATAMGGLRAIRRLLSRCGEVGSLLAQRRLFAALQLMEQVRAQDLALAMDVLSSAPQAALSLLGGDGAVMAAAAAASDAAGGGAAAGANNGGGVGGSGAVARHQAVVSRLRNFLQTLVADQEAAIEYYALAEFNNWLVGVRAESRQVGLRAIRKAAIERQMDEDLAAERRTVAAALIGCRDPSVVATREVVGAAFRRELAQEGAPPQPGAPGATGSAAGGGGPGGGSGRSGRSAAARAAPGPGSGTAPGAPPDLDLATLCPGQPLQAIQALLSRHRAVAAAPLPPSCSLTDYTTALLQGVDMQGLYRCVHIHRCMGRMPSLRRYYLDQRRLQITTDLAPPANFLEAYQSYLAQVTGFFVVEDAVRAVAPDLLSADSAALLWEAAAGSLRGVLGRALEEALAGGAPASIMLLLKDFMLLVCSALGARGFVTAPITELLTGSRLRYHDLLTASVALRVGRALASDSLAAGLEVVSEQQAAELGGRLGLPAMLDGGGGGAQPALPYRAPYTACLPRILQAVRGFVTDSLAYLQGLLSPWELLPAVLQARDRLLAKTVVDALADHTARLLSADGAATAAPSQWSVTRTPWRIREVMRMITNAWCLAIAMQVLDEWTLLQVRPLGAMAAAAAAAAAAGGSTTGGALPSISSVPSPARASGGVGATAGGGAGAAVAGTGGTAVTGGGGFGSLGGLGGDGSTGAVLAALRSVQDGGERGLLRLLAGRVEALVAGAKALQWLPQGPLPSGTSQYADDLLALLKETFDAAATILPRSSFLFLTRAVVRAAGNAFMLLLKEGVKAYNMFAVERLAVDVALLDRFIATCPVPQLAAEFAEPRQLCALLLSPRVEEVLIPEVRQQRYPSLDLGSLVVILERYREQARVGKEKTGHVSKRTLEGVCKQLRGQVVAGTAFSGLRVLEEV